MSDAERLIAGLHADGATAVGAFTVDRAKAREKLRHFQLADPCAWLLELVRAAIAQGARTITIDTDTDDVRMQFDGESFSKEDLDEIYAALLARNAPAARQHLAVALNAALALGPRFVRFESGAHGLEMRPNKDDKPITATTPIIGSVVHVREQFRAGSFVQFFRSLAGARREARALRRACAWSAAHITLDGDVISTRPIPGSTTKQARTSDGAVTVALVDTPDGRVPKDVEAGRIVMLHSGVVLEELVHPAMPPHTFAVVEAGKLPRDASLQAFRREERFDALLDVALGTALALVEASDAEWRKQRAAQHLAAYIVRTHNAKERRGPRVRKVLDDNGADVRRTPIFTDIGGRPVTTNDLLRELKARDKVGFTRNRSDATVDRLVVYLGDDAEAERFFAAVGDAREDASEAVVAALARARNVARLHSRRAKTALPPEVYLARAAFTGQASGEIAVRSSGPQGLVVTWFKDGCVVNTELLPCPLPGLSLAVESAFTLSETCDAVVRDIAFLTALQHAWWSIPDLFAHGPSKASRGDNAEGDVDERWIDRVVPFLAWAADAPGLWDAFRKGLAGLHRTAATHELGPPPSVQLTGKKMHPVAQVPLFRRVDGKRASIADLAKLPTIPVVPHDVVRFSHGDAIRAGDVVRKVLAQIGTLSVFDAQARREARRHAVLDAAAPMRTPPEPLVRFEHDGLTGAIGFGPQDGVTLHAHTSACFVATSILRETPFTELVVSADDPQLLPNADGSVPLAEARRMVCAGLASLPALLADTVSSSSAARRNALHLLAAIVPRPALHDALTALEDHKRASGKGYVGDAVAQYLEVLALATGGFEDVGALIGLVREAGDVPTAKEVDAMARALSTKIPKPNARDLELRLAPFGGRAALAKGARDEPLTERVLARVPALARLAFRTLDRKKLTLAELVQRCSSAGDARVQYVSKEVLFGDGNAPADVLVLDDAERLALQAFLGAARFVDVTEQMKIAAAAQTFRRKPKVQARLEGDAHVVIEALRDGKATGELGVLLPRGALTASVRVLRDGRDVSKHDLSASAPCSFVAVVDDPELAMLPDISAATPERLKEIFALCFRAADAALEMLAADLVTSPLAPDDIATLYTERLARRAVCPMGEDRQRLFERLQLFSDVHGDDVTFAEMRDEIAKHSYVSIVTRALPTTTELPRERTIVVVRDHALKRALDKALAHSLIDVTDQIERLVRIERRIAALDPLPTRPPDALAKVEVEAGVRVHFWVPRGSTSRVIHVGARGKTVAKVRPETPLPVVHGTIEGDSAVNTEFTAIESGALGDRMDAALASLASMLVTRAMRPGVIDDATEDAFVVCRALAVALERDKAGLASRWQRVREEVFNAPLFVAADGARLSMARVLADRPASLEHVWQPHMPPLELVDVADDPDAPGGADDLDAVVVAARRGGARPTIPEPPPPPPRPEDELRERLKETLALVKLEGRAADEVRRRPISVERRGGKRVVVLAKDRTLIDADHALVRAALAAPDDHAPFFMLCAVVYAAIDAELHDVTPEHQRAFLARLLAHAASARP